MSWDEYFMTMAFFVAMKSKDLSSHIGSVIVGPNNEIRSTGYNGFPRGVNDSIIARFQRPMKYDYSEHSERNSLYNAARTGVCTDGCRMYTQGTPCCDCARAIIQSGIKEVIVHAAWELSDVQQKWKRAAEISKEMFHESGVKLRIYDGPIITIIRARFNEQDIDLSKWNENVTKIKD